MASANKKQLKPADEDAKRREVIFENEDGERRVGTQADAKAMSGDGFAPIEDEHEIPNKAALEPVDRVPPEERLVPSDAEPVPSQDL